MKRFLLIFQFLIFVESVFGQLNSLQEEALYIPHLHYQQSRFVFSIGASTGQETFIGLPKGGIYYEFLSQLNRTASRQYGFNSKAFYGGVEGSIFVIFAGVFSLSPNLGIKYGPLTVDNTVSITLVTSPENNSTTYTSYNPKLGAEIGPVRLKAGPSFRISGENEFGKFMHIGSTAFNVELTYLIRAKKK